MGGEMSIVLVEAKGLLAADRGGTSDPYATLKLAGKKKKSKTIKKTLDPRWVEEISFDVQDKSKMGALKLHLWDYDRIGSDDSLGALEISLDAALNAPGALIELYDLALPTQGTVSLRIKWQPKPRIRGGDSTQLGEDDPNNPGAIYDANTHDSHGTLRVQLIGAKGLLAADPAPRGQPKENGSSDPYVVFLVHADKKKSSVVKKSLNPTWNETFEWTGPKSMMGVLDFVVWDKDPGFNKDDRLGSAQLNLAELGLLDDGAGAANQTVDLNTQGSVSLRLDWRTSDEDAGPETDEAVIAMSEEAFLQAWRDEEDAEPFYNFSLESLGRTLPGFSLLHCHATVTMRITIKGGYALLAADNTGTSDPYVVLKLPASWQADGQMPRTRTVPKTTFPVWEETFEVTRPVHDLCSKPLRFEVFDDDKFSQDDSIGTTALSHETIEALFEKMHRKQQEVDGQELWLKLGTKGYLGVRVYLVPESYVVPSYASLLSSVLEPARTAMGILHNLPSIIRRTYTDATIRVTLKSGAKLPASDLSFSPLTTLRSGGSTIGATSDPYVIINLMGIEARSKTLFKTLNPVWDEPFEFQGMVKDLCAKNLEMTLYDADQLNEDDLIGFSDLHTNKLTSLFVDKEGNDLPRDEDGTDFTCQLTSKGSLTINVAVLSRPKPSWFEVAVKAAKPLFDVLEYIRNVPTLAQHWRHVYMKTTVTVTLVRANNLLAADRDLLGRRTSDPYVNFELAGEVAQSTTKYKTLDPEWNEVLTPFYKTMGDLESDADNSLNVEVFDDDLLDADDPIGMAVLPISPTILDLAGQGPKEFTLKLSTQGDITLVVDVAPFEKPSWPVVVLEVCRPWLLEVRAFILYYRLPYDLTIWSKLLDPWYYVVTLIAASTNTLVRGGFFTVYLVCVITAGFEEYVVMRFILGLKGTQFISGIIKTTILCFKFWKCAVTSLEPGGCESSGPGVGHHSAFSYLSVLIWLQVLLWAAFLVLPYAGQLNPTTGKINYSRSKGLLAEATAWALDRQKRRLRKRQVRLERKSMVESVPKEAEGKSPRRSYARVEDLEAPPPVSVATYPDPLPAGAGHYERAIFWLAYQGARMHERVEELTVQWDTLTYPMRSGQQQNRLFSLLKWDTFASFFCLALFFILVLDAEWAREIVDAGDGREALGRDPLWHVVMVCTDMLSVFGSNFWYEWRTQITFQIIKVLFSLSAVPFFIFTIGPFAKLFAHTDPTAYDRNGRLVTPDPSGLSAYVRWLKSDILCIGESYVAWVLGSHKYAHELEERFPERDMKKLYRAVREADHVLQTAWKKPSSARREMLAQKRKLEKLLSEIVTEQKASRDLFIKCFPDHHIVKEYVEKQAILAEQEKEKKAAKAGKAGKQKASPSSSPSPSAAQSKPLVATTPAPAPASPTTAVEATIVVGGAAAVGAMSAAVELL